MKQLYFLFFFLAAYSAIYTQEADIGDFNLSGDAVITGANCIRLTPDRIWSGGSAWHKQAIDLNFPFEMKLQIMLGCKDDAGADGIVFVFHPNARRTGYQGEGMGFAGLEPSLGIEIDTWLNEHLGDPYQDHIALLRDGSVHHGYNLAGPAPIPNVEDCREHALAVSWSPGSRQLRIKLDKRSPAGPKAALQKIEQVSLKFIDLLVVHAQAKYPAGIIDADQDGTSLVVHEGGRRPDDGLLGGFADDRFELRALRLPQGNQIGSRHKAAFV